MQEAALEDSLRAGKGASGGVGKTMQAAACFLQALELVRDGQRALLREGGETRDLSDAADIEAGVEHG